MVLKNKDGSSITITKDNRPGANPEALIVTKIKVVREKVEVVKREIQIQKEIINADCKLSETAIDLYNKAVAEPTEDKQVGDTKWDYF